MYQKGGSAYCKVMLRGSVERITQPGTSIERTLWTTEGAQVAPQSAQSEIAPEMERT